eukprot:3706309-Lingulodinium_polyedra.AAC.1
MAFLSAWACCKQPTPGPAGPPTGASWPGWPPLRPARAVVQKWRICITASGSAAPTTGRQRSSSPTSSTTSRAPSTWPPERQGRERAKPSASGSGAWCRSRGLKPTMSSCRSQSPWRWALPPTGRCSLVVSTTPMARAPPATSARGARAGPSCSSTTAWSSSWASSARSTTTGTRSRGLSSPRSLNWRPGLTLSRRSRSMPTACMWSLAASASATSG